MTNPPPPPSAPTPWPQPNARMPHWPRLPANTPPTTPRCTASPACSPIWPPSAPTRFSPPKTCRHSPRSPAPPHCNGEPSNSSTSHPAWATRRQQPTPPTPKSPGQRTHANPSTRNFGLAAVLLLFVIIFVRTLASSLAIVVQEHHVFSSLVPFEVRCMWLRFETTAR